LLKQNYFHVIDACDIEYRDNGILRSFYLDPTIKCVKFILVVKLIKWTSFFRLLIIRSYWLLTSSMSCDTFTLASSGVLTKELLMRFFLKRSKFPNATCAMPLRKLWNILIVSLEASGRYLRKWLQIYHWRILRINIYIMVK